jgi:glycosyltransferase involved in cell wall biosynthesis
MVLTEAMAFGTVPFAFDSYSAVHDIIEDGRTGVLVTPFSIKEYTDKLTILMLDEEERDRMSENCMKDVTRFSLDSIVDQWVHLFETLKEE